MTPLRPALACVLLALTACASSELELPGPDAGSARDSGPADASPAPDAAAPDAAPQDVGSADADASNACAGDGDCPAGRTCDLTSGACVPEATSTCGDGVCDGVETCATCLADCGCQDNQTCSAGACACDDPCQPGQTQCAGADEQVCAADANGCAYLEPPTSCATGVCSNGSCCDAMCGVRECGADACGGSCGTCSYSCDPGGYCARQLVVNWVRTDCDADCQDVFDPTDPYIEVTLAGQSFDRDKGERDRCDDTLTAQGWTVGGAARTFSYTQLRAVRVEVLDEDRASSDDTCATWSRVDLSAVGTTEVTSSDGLVTVSFTTRI